MPALQQETNPVNNLATNPQEFDMSRLDNAPQVYQELAKLGKREHIDSTRLDPNLKAELKATFTAQMNADLKSGLLPGFNPATIGMNKIPNDLSSDVLRNISKIYQNQINIACQNCLVESEVIIDGFIGRETLAARAGLFATLGHMVSLKGEVEKDLKAQGKMPKGTLTDEQNKEIARLDEQINNISKDEDRLLATKEELSENLKLASTNPKEFIRTGFVSPKNETQEFENIISTIGDTDLKNTLAIDSVKELTNSWTNSNIEKLAQIIASIPDPGWRTNDREQNFENLKEVVSKKIHSVERGMNSEAVFKGYVAADKFKLDKASEALEIYNNLKSGLVREKMAIQNNPEVTLTKEEAIQFDKLVQEEMANRVRTARSVIDQEQKNSAHAALQKKQAEISNLNLPQLDTQALEQDVANKMGYTVDSRFKKGADGQGRVFMKEASHKAGSRSRQAVSPEVQAERNRRLLLQERLAIAKLEKQIAAVGSTNPNTTQELREQLEHARIRAATVGATADAVHNGADVIDGQAEIAKAQRKQKIAHKEQKGANSEGNLRKIENIAEATEDALDGVSGAVDGAKDLLGNLGIKF